MTRTAPVHAEQCSGSTSIRRLATAPDAVRDVSPLGISAHVYNITVDDAHEYFANGVLVSNCDSSLYLIRKMMPRYDPKESEPEPGTPEAIRLEMKRLKEAEIKRREKLRGGGRYG